MLMTPLLDADDLRSAEQASPDQPVLSLLGDLEASLKAAQQELLARNLPGIEQRTRELLRLQRGLLSRWTQVPQHCQHESASETAPIGELREAAGRVLEQGRIQAALLARAQRSLKMIVNLLAGIAPTYSSVALRRTSYPASSICDAGDEPPCRV